MQYCQKCRIQIRGNKACCPLCQATLGGHPEPDVFPVLKKNPFTSVMIARICTFILISWLIILGAIELITHFQVGWAFAAGLVGIIIWLDVLIGLTYRSDMLKMITSQTYIIMLICLAIDILTGFRSWSLSYILPIGFLWLVFATLGIARSLDMGMNEYIVYLVVDIFLCMLQLIPVLNGWNHFIIPAVVCMTVMAILTAWALIFNFGQVKNAVLKLLNL